MAAAEPVGAAMRILQLSDPHLLADPAGLCRGRFPLPLLRHGLGSALNQLAQRGTPPDWLLLSGDLCHDETWGGYARLRELLAGEPHPGRSAVASLAPAIALPAPPLPPAALLPGNHEHRLRLQAALGRHATLAPSRLCLDAKAGQGAWRLLLLDSHCPGRIDGRLGLRQRQWLEAELVEAERTGAFLLLAVHHPPGPIGDAFLDSIALADGPTLLALLAERPVVRGLVFGHVHQYWQGWLPGPPGRPLLGCPSTLCPFGPVQPCPLGRAQDPGGLLLELGAAGEIRHEVLRWDPLSAPSVSQGPVRSLP
jgi:Icc protein